MKLVIGKGKNKRYEVAEVEGFDVIRRIEGEEIIWRKDCNSEQLLIYPDTTEEGSPVAGIFRGKTVEVITDDQSRIYLSAAVLAEGRNRW